MDIKMDDFKSYLDSKLKQHEESLKSFFESSLNNFKEEIEKEFKDKIAHQNKLIDELKMEKNNMKKKIQKRRRRSRSPDRLVYQKAQLMFGIL